jgi:hypothetical protein
MLIIILKNIPTLSIGVISERMIFKKIKILKIMRSEGYIIS